MDELEKAKLFVRVLRSPFRNVDDKDWAWLINRLGDGGHGKFWKDVMTEMRGAIEMTKPTTVE